MIIHGRGEMFIKKVKKLKGFTLAEVLITLGIIGVVAALTIPTLISNYQKSQTISQLKKAYSELSQAVKLSEIDNGPSQNWDWGIQGGESTSTDFFNTFWKPYLRVQKICTTYKDCSYTNSTYDMVNGGPSWLSLATNTSRTLLALQDGTILCIVSSSYDSDGNPISYRFIYADINGAKKPNSIGRDVFVFTLSSSGLTPYGTANDCITTDSRHCAAKIISDGWQIKDDYPWQR